MAANVNGMIEMPDTAEATHSLKEELDRGSMAKKVSQYMVTLTGGAAWCQIRLCKTGLHQRNTAEDVPRHAR
jgi:hypothetical protein